MSRSGDAQEIFDAIRVLKDKITDKRRKLAQSGAVPAQWPLDSEDEVISFVSNVADKLDLKPELKLTIIGDVKNRLKDRSGERVTVAMLESDLLDLQALINNVLLAKIIVEISTPKIRIENATNELILAIERLEDLNELFGAIAVGVNLVTAFVAASGGNFSVLASIIPKLVS